MVLGCVVIRGLSSGHFLKRSQSTQRGIQGAMFVGRWPGDDLFRPIKDRAASKRDRLWQALTIEFEDRGLIKPPPRCTAGRTIRKMR